MGVSTYCLLNDCRRKRQEKSSLLSNSCIADRVPPGAEGYYPVEPAGNLCTSLGARRLQLSMYALEQNIASCHAGMGRGVMIPDVTTRSASGEKAEGSPYPHRCRGRRCKGTPSPPSQGWRCQEFFPTDQEGALEFSYYI